MLAMASEFIVFACEDRHHQTLGRYHEDSLVPQADRSGEVNSAHLANPPLITVTPVRVLAPHPVGERGFAGVGL